MDHFLEERRVVVHEHVKRRIVSFHEGTVGVQAAGRRGEPEHLHAGQGADKLHKFRTFLC